MENKQKCNIYGTQNSFMWEIKRSGGGVKHFYISIPGDNS